MSEKFGICLIKPFYLENDELFKRMVDFTEFYINRINSVEHIIDFYSVDTFENHIENHHKNYEYLIFISAGVRIYHTKHFIKIIDEMVSSNPKSGLFGHILDRFEDWYQVHHQFFIVKTSIWEKCGKPNFGKDGDSTNLISSVDRSIENYHDDYTPYWVKYKGYQEKTDGGLRYGWELMNSILKHGYNVTVINKRLKNIKPYVYPEYLSDKFLNSIKTKEYSDDNGFMKVVLFKSILNSSKNNIYLINTEENSITTQSDITPFDTILLPCAGLKYLSIIKEKLYHPKTKVIFYDFNEFSIMWFKHFISNFKGDFEEVINTFTYKKQFGIFNYGKDYVYEQIENNVNYYGGKEEFFKIFNEFKKLNIEYIQVDLLNSPNILIDTITDGRTLINISNIFSTDYVNLFFTKKEREELFETFIDKLPPQTYVVGRNHLPKYFEYYNE